MKEDSSRKDNERRISEEASGSIRGYLGGIWEASRGIWKHLKTSGDIQGPCDPESGDIKGPSEKGGSFTIVKMGSKRRDRPFYRRVAKVGGTKYRKTHGSRAETEATEGIWEASRGHLGGIHLRFSPLV